MKDFSFAKRFQFFKQVSNRIKSTNRRRVLVIPDQIELGRWKPIRKSKKLAFAMVEKPMFPKENGSNEFLFDGQTEAGVARNRTVFASEITTGIFIQNLLYACFKTIINIPAFESQSNVRIYIYELQQSSQGAT